MGSSNSKQNYTANPVGVQEMDPAVKQFLQNINMLTNVVCQQPNPQSASGTGANPNTVVFYPVQQQAPQWEQQAPQWQQQTAQWQQGPSSSYYDESSIIVFQTENYENAHDSLNYGTVKDTWKKQPKYSL